MTQKKALLRAAVLLGAWVTVFPAQLFAYLDPGTGSLIIQGVIAAVAAVGYGMRLYWTRIRTWVRGGNPADSPEATGDRATDKDA